MILTVGCVLVLLLASLPAQAKTLHEVYEDTQTFDVTLRADPIACKLPEDVEGTETTDMMVRLSFRSDGSVQEKQVWRTSGSGVGVESGMEYTWTRDDRYMVVSTADFESQTVNVTENRVYRSEEGIVFRDFLSFHAGEGNSSVHETSTGDPCVPGMHHQHFEPVLNINRGEPG